MVRSRPNSISSSCGSFVAFLVSTTDMGACDDSDSAGNIAFGKRAEPGEGCEVIGTYGTSAVAGGSWTAVGVAGCVGEWGILGSVFLWSGIR